VTPIAVIGTVAALCTTGAFIPQIVKIRKQGGEDLSYSMLLVYLFGVLLWLIYGIMFRAPAVIWANIAATLLVSTSIAMKAAWNGKQKTGRSRLRVAVDMDEVIADALTRHLDLYNRATGENVSAEAISREEFDRVIKYREVFERIPHEQEFFDDLGLIKDSQCALRLLSSHFDIFITSAAMEVPGSFEAKFKWLQKYFPFIPTSNLVFCGDKEIINADYLIDDRSRHFARFRGTGILFTAPHNARERAHLRANNWEEVLEILLKLKPQAQGSKVLNDRSRQPSTIGAELQTEG
jgi:5'(3')-deoxyribonucleotidase/uncharacterized protein with PQ loop repeat